tara:strand:- start:1717 stop:2226 length:510 start_codon:yes stop_codon:yes gene_type:complete
MEITIENIAPAFRPFIDKIELGFDGIAVLIWLKEGYVFSATSADHRLFTYDDYRNSRYPEHYLEQAIDRCLADELLQVTIESWYKREQITTDQIVDRNPAKLFRSGIVNHDYEVEIEAWIKVSKTYSVSAPNKETAKAIAMEVAKGDNKNLQDRDQLIFSVKATDCKEK